MPDWLLLDREKLPLCVGVGGLSVVSADVLPSATIASVSLESSSCSGAPRLSGVVTVDKCSSQITVSFSRTAGWHDVTREYFDSGFVSDVAFLTTESKDLGNIMLFLLNGFFLMYQYANTRITIVKRIRGATTSIHIESF